jgi:hypothetical protein
MRRTERSPQKGRTGRSPGTERRTAPAARAAVSCAAAAAARMEPAILRTGQRAKKTLPVALRVPPDALIRIVLALTAFVVTVSVSCLVKQQRSPRASPLLVVLFDIKRRTLFHGMGQIRFVQLTV